MKTVSVIIPTYNDTQRLRWVLEGLLAQTYDDFEVIVVNDGGDESTSGLVREYENSLNAYCLYLDPLTPDFRAAAARNLGVKFSSGEVLIFLDTDCVPAPNLVETHLDNVVPNSVLCGRRRFIDENVAEAMELPLDYEALRAVSHPDEYPDDANVFLSCHLGMLAELFCAYGGFDESFVGYGAEDQELMCRYARAGVQFVNLKGTEVIHLWHPPRATHQPINGIERLIPLRDSPLVANGGPLLRIGTEQFVGAA